MYEEIYQTLLFIKNIKLYIKHKNIHNINVYYVKKRIFLNTSFTNEVLIHPFDSTKEINNINKVVPYDYNQNYNTS